MQIPLTRGRMGIKGKLQVSLKFKKKKMSVKYYFRGYDLKIAKNPVPKHVCDIHDIHN